MCWIVDKTKLNFSLKDLLPVLEFSLSKQVIIVQCLILPGRIKEDGYMSELKNETKVGLVRAINVACVFMSSET